MAILLYTLGLSFNAIARIYGVATSTVMRWVRDFAEKTYEKPSPGEAVIIELDEMWHYLHSKKTNYGSGKLRECPAYILLYQFSPKDTGQSKVK